MNATAILQPVFALAILTFIMTLWMLCTRIPAMMRLKIHPQKGQDTSKLRDLLPHDVNRISNNYNHLLEQPTLFYAIALAVAALGHTDSFNVICAWTYVALRVCHSLVQALVDIVMIRFYLFIASWLVLGILIVREALRIF